MMELSSLMSSVILPVRWSDLDPSETLPPLPLRVLHSVLADRLPLVLRRCRRRGRTEPPHCCHLLLLCGLHGGRRHGTNRAGVWAGTFSCLLEQTSGSGRCTKCKAWERLPEAKCSTPPGAVLHIWVAEGRASARCVAARFEHHVPVHRIAGSVF